MKKNIFFAFLAGAALVGCSSSDMIEEVVEEQTPIDFSAYTQKTTRAAITSNADLATEGGFVVYGYKSTTKATMDWSAYQTIFDGVNVHVKSGEDGAYITGTSTDWTYDTKKYWDKNATYCFYAVAPYNPTSGATYGVSSDAVNAKMITITGATSGLASASDDHLIDRDGVLNRNGSNTTDNVDFDFHHVMAKVGFLLKKNSDITQEVKVQSITMSGWDSGKGNFTQNTTTNPTTLVCGEWNIPTAGEGSESILTGETAALSATAAACTSKTYIMVPQAFTANKLKFTINYTIGTESYTNEVATIAEAHTWGTDSYTTYTITVGPAAIEFDVNSICNWDVTGTGSVTVQ